MNSSLQPKYRTSDSSNPGDAGKTEKPNGASASESWESLLESLHLCEERYLSIVEDDQDLICRYTLDGTLTFVNDAYCHYFSKQKEELIGQSFLPLVPEQDREKVKTHCSVLTEQNPVGEIEHRVVDGVGRLRWQKWIDRALFDSKGDLCEYQSVGWEIPHPRHGVRDRSDPDRELRCFLQMEAFEPVLRGIIHSVYDLFTGLLGSIGLAELEAPDGIQEYLSGAALAVRRSEKLLRQLTIFSRQPVTELRPVNVNLAVKETCSLLSHRIEPNVAIDLDLAATVPDVIANNARLQSVLTNLCLHSARRMAEREKEENQPSDTPRILIATRVLQAGTLPWNIANSGESKEYVLLSVSDNAPPLDVETQRWIVDPLSAIEHAREEIPVLWLNVYGLVKQYRGWIHVANGSDNGNTIEIYLPATDPDGESVCPNSGEEKYFDGTETVLLADDEDVIRCLAETVLTRHGYKVLVAANGKEAVNEFLEHRDNIDLILLDVSMPYLTGIEALEQIRAISPDMNVVLSSGFTDNGNEDFLARIGVSHFLPKPYRPHELLKIIRYVLDHSRKT